MATITAGSSASLVTCASLAHSGRAGASASPILGLLPAMTKKLRVYRSVESESPSTTTTQEKASIKGMSASLLAATAAGMMSSPAAMALVDERMSTEGTGLPFGLSNNLLGWILLGVFAFIWSFYTVYTSGLDEDEESGMSL